MRFIQTLHRLFMQVSVDMSADEISSAFSFIKKIITLHLQQEAERNNTISDVAKNVCSSQVVDDQSTLDPPLSADSTNVCPSQVVDPPISADAMNICSSQVVDQPAVSLPVLTPAVCPIPDHTVGQNPPYKTKRQYRADKKALKRLNWKTVDVYCTDQKLLNKFKTRNYGQINWNKYIWKGEPDKNVICDTRRNSLKVMRAGSSAIYVGPPQWCPKDVYISTHGRKVNEMGIKYLRQIPRHVAEHLCGTRILERCTGKSASSKRPLAVIDLTDDKFNNKPCSPPAFVATDPLYFIVANVVRKIKQEVVDQYPVSVNYS